MAARLRRWWALAAFTGLLAVVAVPIAEANTPQAPIQIGRMWMNPEYDGAEGWSGSMVHYPAGIPNPSYTDLTNQIKRGWVGHGQKTGNYLFATDWTDPASASHEYASSYFFRSMDYTPHDEWVPGTAGVTFNYAFDGGIQEYYRWSRPRVIVRNAPATINPDTTIEVKFFPGPGPAPWPDNPGSGPRPLPIVNPNMVTEIAVNNWWRHIQGVELQRWNYAYPYGSPHQDYVLWDTKLKNNGISGTSATAPVLASQTINNMVWANGYDFRDNYAPMSAQIGRDADGMVIEPWGSPGHKAFLLWDTDDETATGNQGPDWGDPSENALYNGHLMGNAYVLVGGLFSSAGPGASYGTDDSQQPAFNIFYRERGLDFAGQPYSPTSPQLQREFLVTGDYAIPLNTSYREDPVSSDIVNYDPGPTVILGYGPIVSGGAAKDQGWDLAFNDSVRVIQVWAAGGIDATEGQRIGNLWNARKTAGDPASTWMDASDIELVKTGRDTVMKAAAMAYWNVNGAFPANVTGTDLSKWGIADHDLTKDAPYNQRYNVPEAPRPPGMIVTRQVSTGIEVRWTQESETDPDFDTQTADFVGYRVYRQEGSRTATWELVASGPVATFGTATADGDLPAGRIYIDTDVTTGLQYWYSVTAYDDGTQNWAQPNKVLESSRWYTYTGYALSGTRAGVIGPGAITEKGPARFALEQNVPNPFNPATTINFSIGTAGNVKLAIYNANGQIVRTLVNEALSAGTHQVVWDGMDQSGRPSASGVYIYRLVSGRNTIAKRMVLVR